ncbi:hypothetical protein EJD97_007171 [Solanum chilense]|uniref:Gag-pol polyprotein n=1 Tax=Solanum chilense TaxID=4083 RepID=A0A6N2BPK0_SOLCI|nr:hypothetical protein EJD97_007171 [Solanum chilense]
MNTIRASIRRSEEGIANAIAHDNQAPPQKNQVPPLEQVTMGDKVPLIPPPIMDGEIREVFLNLAQAMTSQAMTAQVNREVGPNMAQHASTMASRLRDFTRMNPPVFFGSKMDEDPKYFLDEV